MSQSISKQGRPWPLFQAFSGYQLPFLARDLSAGLILAAIAIPEQMATARLGGFPPEIGFFAFFAGAIAFAIFGASRFLSSGADSTITPIFAASLAVLSATGTPHYAASAALLSLMVGVILVCGGLLRLGWIADLLSVPVTTGFLAGIGIHILASQLPGALGIETPASDIPHRVLEIVQRLGHANLWSVAIGFGVLVLTWGSERISARIPGALIALALATAATFAFHLDGRGVHLLGAVSGRLPKIVFPAAPLSEILHLIPLALVIALVVMVQTASVSRAFPSDPGEAPDVDRDFVGVGAGSVLAAFFGAFPVDASPPRTAIVAETGGRSQAAGLAAALIVLILFLYGGTLLAHVPAAALAGILLFIGLRIIRLPELIAIRRRAIGEFLLALATIFAIIVMPIQTGIATGIVLSLLYGMWVNTRTRPVVFERIPGTTVWWPKAPGHPSESVPGVAVVAFQAPLSFVNAYAFRRNFVDLLDGRPETRLVVLEATGIVEIDYTAATLLADIIRRCEQQNVVFTVARLESVRAQEAFRRFGLFDLMKPAHVFQTVEEAVRTLAPAASAPGRLPQRS